jgi:tryptophan 2,3-dioxygenase
MARFTLSLPLPPKDPNFDLAANHYWVYQRLDQLLSLKHPVTESEDEDLFITVHQICEITFHQMILDLDRALRGFRAALDETSPLGDTDDACYFIERVSRLYDVVITATPILTTMRAFSEFRPSLGPSSGFQSYQFRRLEIMAGLTELFWRGGTRGTDGKVQSTETEFDRVFGAQLAACFEQYKQHSLRHYFSVLTQRAPVEDLRKHPTAPALLEKLSHYQQTQLRFHRVHRQLAMHQLALVGAPYGTGGTAYKEYLQKYEREQAPLFPGLA